MIGSFPLIPSLAAPRIGFAMAGLPARRSVQLLLPLAGLLRCAGSAALVGGCLTKRLAACFDILLPQELHERGIGRDQARRRSVNHLSPQGRKVTRRTLNPSAPRRHFANGAQVAR